MKIEIPSHLSDVDLVAEVQRFTHCERTATAQLVAHLAELDTRRLYLGAGFASLFTYCSGVLALSEHEVYNRIEAARAARRFPAILDLLSEGSLNLTTVRLLAPHLTDDNCEELLAAASRRSKRQVEELLARRFPRPDEPSLIRRLPTATLATAPSVASVAPAVPPSSGDPRDVRSPEPFTPASVPRSTERVPPARTPRPVVAPLAEDRYVIKFTATAATCEKLRRAQDLLRHAVPDGDPAEIVDRALTVLLEDLARKKFAATERPRPARDSGGRSRHVPAAVKRAVWLRDAGRCAFVSNSGRRCGERGCLEVPPRLPLRGRWCGHREEYRAALSGPQRVRVRPLLRSGHNDRW